MRSSFPSRRAVILLVAAACFLAPLLVVQLPFITGARLYFHDSLVGSSSLGLFYDRIFSGDSWLWSSSMNAGHPIWMDIEIAPFLDPIAGAVYLVSAASKSDWQTAYQITVVLWHVAFALGGALCARRLTGDVWAGLLAGLLLWNGPLAVAIPGQSWGFLLPFRYLPLIVYLYLRLRSRASAPAALYLGTLLAFSLSGYQSAYLAVALAFLVAADLAVHRREFLDWLRQVLRPGCAVSLGIPLLAILPALAFLHYSRNLVVLPRLYNPDRVYFFEFRHFVSHLSYFSFSNWEGLEPRLVWHGSAFLGLLAVPLLFHGARKALEPFIGTARASVGHKWFAGHKWFLVLLVWFVGVSVASFGGLGLADLVERRGSFLGIRNFGFLLTCQVFILVLMAAVGFHRLLSDRFGFADVGINILLFALFVGLAGLTVGFEAADPVRSLAAVAIFAAVSLLLWRLRAVAPSAALAPTVVVILLIEGLALTRPAVISLAETAGSEQRAEDALARRPRFQARRETFVQHRAFERRPEEDWPFSLLSTAVFKTPAAYLPPLYINSTGMLTTSHFFRSRAYEALVAGETDAGRLRQILGVTRPILELVSPAALREEDGGFLLVLAEDRDLPEPGAAGLAGVLEFKGDRIVVDVTAVTDAVLVYRDNMAPDWSVEIDGREAELLVVDRVNKAVAVSGGRHQVVFVYRPWLYLAAFVLRALALAGAVLACAWTAVAAWRHRGAAKSP